MEWRFAYSTHWERPNFSTIASIVSLSRSSVDITSANQSSTDSYSSGSGNSGMALTEALSLLNSLFPVDDEHPVPMVHVIGYGTAGRMYTESPGVFLTWDIAT